MQQYVRHIGFDLSTGKELDKTAQVYNTYALHDRIWQGDGITNCVSTLRSNKDLKKAINLRDLGGHPQKVRGSLCMFWTSPKVSPKVKRLKNAARKFRVVAER